MELAPGVQEEMQLQEAGFSEDEISQWRDETASQLKGGGFTDEEINEYFGEKVPDMAPVEAGIKDNFKRYAEANAAKQSTGQAQEGGAQVAPETAHAQGLAEAIEAGLEMSVSGLILTGKPNTVLPEHAPMYMRIASQVGTLAGDMPAILAGLAAGGAAGSAVAPGVGTAVGGAAGAMALPEAMRTAYMEKFEKGEIKSFSDFWERTSAVFLSAVKGGTVGAMTAGVGGVVGRSAISAAAKPAAVLASEVATMTTVGAALEGRVPEPQEFLDGAILVGGIHGASHIAPKLSQIYARFGKRPSEVFEAAQKDPKLAQELRAKNVDIPVSGELGITREMVNESRVKTEAKSQKPAKAEPVVEHDAATSEILSKIKNEKIAAPEGSFSEIASERFNEGYRNFVDKLDPIKRATEELKKNVDELKPDDNPFLLARTNVDANSKTQTFLEKGTFAFEGAVKNGKLKTNGESFDAILKDIKNKEEFNAYAVSKRVIEKEAQGKKTGFNVEAAKEVISKFDKEYSAQAKRMTEFNNRIKDYVADSGLISKEALANFKKSETYIPFKRIFEFDDSILAKKGGGKSGSLKEFKGSEKDILNPLAATVENTEALIKLAEANRSKVKFVELAEKAGEQNVIVKINDPLKKIEISAEEVAKQLDISIDDAKAIQTFRTVRQPLAPNQFAIMRDGKREVYQTRPDLAEAINSLGGDAGSQSVLLKIARAVTTVKKLGITFTPDFIAKNLIRDYITGGVQGPTKGIITPGELSSAVADIVKKTDNYYAWKASGGANGAWLDLQKSYVDTKIFELDNQTGFIAGARNVIKKPIDMMRVAAEISEQSVRLAQFKKSVKQGLSTTESAISARDVTLDFSRMGAKMSAINSITAFMNVGIQGADRIAQAYKADPVGTNNKAMALISVPTLLLWAANRDDERIKRLSRWEKDLFWIIGTDDWQESKDVSGLPDYLVKVENDKTYVNKGVLYKIPKPGPFGLMYGTLLERTLDATVGDNDEAYKGFAKSLLDNAAPNYVPDFSAPALEQFFNKSFFTGNDIVPEYLQGVMPEHQSVEYTSETAKVIGKIIANVDHSLTDSRTGLSSPMVIDNYIQSWGGALGKYAVKISDEALLAAGITERPEKPTPTLSDIPFIKAFVVRYPQSNSIIQDFYDMAEKSGQVAGSVERLMKTGKIEEAEKLMRERQVEFMIGKMSEGVKKGLSAQSAVIQNIYRSDMTRDEKRDQIDRMYMSMMQTAEDALNQLREFEKQNTLKGK